MAAGSILFGDVLRMSSTQKTFALAVSSQMAPHARIVAYYFSGWEVITDTLNFHVKDTRLSKVCVTNLGKENYALNHVRYRYFKEREKFTICSFPHIRCHPLFWANDTLCMLKTL